MKAAALFVVRNGKITLWQQVAGAEAGRRADRLGGGELALQLVQVALAIAERIDDVGIELLPGLREDLVARDASS